MTDIKHYNTLKKYGEKLGREEISKRIMILAKDILEQNSYKNAIIAAGHIKALAQACNFDCYWSEKINIGYMHEVDRAESFLREEASSDEVEG